MRNLWYYFFPRGRHARLKPVIITHDTYLHDDGEADGTWEHTDMFEYIKEPDPDHQTDGGNTVLAGQDPGSPGDPGPPRTHG